MHRQIQQWSKTRPIASIIFKSWIDLCMLIEQQSFVSIAYSSSCHTIPRLYVRNPQSTRGWSLYSTYLLHCMCSWHWITVRVSFARLIGSRCGGKNTHSWEYAAWSVIKTCVSQYIWVTYIELISPGQREWFRMVVRIQGIFQRFMYTSSEWLVICFFIVRISSHHMSTCHKYIYIIYIYISGWILPTSLMMARTRIWGFIPM